MNGRCDNDPLDRAENVCDKCGGDFCDSCLLYPRGKKKAPVCKACAIAKAGLRSTSKSQTSLERKNVRKRRKELQEQVEEHDDGAFVYFDEDGSDIVLRDRSVLLPPVEEEEPGRRFGKKTKSAAAAGSDKAPASKQKKDKPSKQKAPKKTKTVAEDDGASTELPPPPSATDAVEDPDKTVDLDEALMGYSGKATDDEHVADSDVESADTGADSFGGDTSTPAPGTARSMIDDKGAGSRPSDALAGHPASTNDRPSASELLARLKEAEASREEEEPVAQASAVEPAASDPWIPPAMAGGTSTDANDAKVDVSVNPFASATPEREPMDTWEPPSVTPEREPMDTWEPPSVTADSIAPNETTVDHDPTVDFLPYEVPAALEAPVEGNSVGSALPEPEELITFDDSASFTHDPAFESDDFATIEFDHDPGFAADQHVELEPVDQHVELEPVGALAVPPQLESTFDAVPELESIAQESPESGDDSPTKADTDNGGNWIPPALRGMAPKSERDADTLPKRRGADD